MPSTALMENPGGDNLRPGEPQEENYLGVPLTITHRPGNNFSGPGDYNGFLPGDVSYGYVEGTMGADEDDPGLPVLVRLQNESEEVFLVAMTDEGGGFVGYYALLGFDDSDAANQFCKSQWGDSPLSGELTQMTLDDFEEWVQDQEIKAQKAEIENGPDAPEDVDTEEQEDGTETDDSKDGEYTQDPDLVFEEEADPSADRYQLLMPDDKGELP